MNTDSFGPQPEARLQTTPLMVNGVLYATVGTRRAAVALDAATGELLWMHRLDEGERGETAPRRLSGRGLTYFDDGGSGVVLYVTPGYQMVALDASNGHRREDFGTDGVIDLKQNIDQDLEATADIGTDCFRKHHPGRRSSFSGGRPPFTHQRQGVLSRVRCQNR